MVDTDATRNLGEDSVAVEMREQPEEVPRVRRPWAQTDYRVLEAAAWKFVVPQSGFTNPRRTTRRFGENHVTLAKLVSLAFRGLELHLQQVGKIKAALLDVGGAEIVGGEL